MRLPIFRDRVLAQFFSFSIGFSIDSSIGSSISSNIYQDSGYNNDSNFGSSRHSTRTTTPQVPLLPFALFFLVQLLSLQTRLFNMITKQATFENFTIVFFQAEYYLYYINPSLLLHFSFISDVDPSFTPSKAIASNLQ